jgi:hypothetical protein
LRNSPLFVGFLLSRAAEQEAYANASAEGAALDEPVRVGVRRVNRRHAIVQTSIASALATAEVTRRTPVSGAVGECRCFTNDTVVGSRQCVIFECVFSNNPLCARRSQA